MGLRVDNYKERGKNSLGMVRGSQRTGIGILRQLLGKITSAVPVPPYSASTLETLGGKGGPVFTRAGAWS